MPIQNDSSSQILHTEPRSIDIADSDLHATPRQSWGVVKLKYSCRIIGRRRLKILKIERAALVLPPCHILPRKCSPAESHGGYMSCKATWHEMALIRICFRCRRVAVMVGPALKIRDPCDSRLWVSPLDKQVVSAALMQHLLIRRSLRACQEVDVYSRSSRNN